MRVILVTGLPCSGKTTHVSQHKRPGDLVVDYDAIAVALGSPDAHDHPPSMRPFIGSARSAVLRHLDPRSRTRHALSGTAWVISCIEEPDLVAIADQVVRLDVDGDECKRRAVDAGRPASWLDLIDRLTRSAQAAQHFASWKL